MAQNAKPTKFRQSLKVLKQLSTGDENVSILFNTLSYPTLAYPTLGYPTLAYPTMGYPALGYPTLGYTTLAYPVLSYEGHIPKSDNGTHIRAHTEVGFSAAELQDFL